MKRNSFSIILNIHPRLFMNIILDDERSESCESDMEDIDAEDDQFFDAMDMFDKSEDQV